MPKRRMPQEPGSEAKKGTNTPKKSQNKGSEPKSMLSQPSIISALTSKGAESPTPKAAHLTEQIKQCNRDLINAKGVKEQARLSKTMENLECQLKRELTTKKPSTFLRSRAPEKSLSNTYVSTTGTYRRRRLINSK